MNTRTSHSRPRLLTSLRNRKSLVFWLAVVSVLSQVSICAQAQSAVTSASAVATKSPDNLVSDSNQYRIGPGDVLDVKVFGKPQFDRLAVKVDPRGMIRMPLIKEEIRAACRTEDELAVEVTRVLKEFILAPEVTVQIKEYLAEPVAVLGAVRTPSRFQLQRRVRLLELITFVNGPTDNAGPTIQVVHMGPVASCATSSTENSDSLGSQIDYYKLSETLRGDEKANPFLRAGDVVSIAKADEVYVVGNVVRPTAIGLNEPLTVTRAIAMAGGTLIDTKKTEIHVLRQTPGTTEKKDIIVNLEAIQHHKAEDLVLVANDIVDVPASGGKRFLRSLLGAVGGTVAQLPVTVIP